DLQPGTSYDVAVRYRRGPHFTPGYENDPDTWPSYEAGAFVTAVGAPVIQQVTWERVSATEERCNVAIMPASSTDLRLYRSDDGGVSWSIIATITSAQHAGQLYVYHDTTVTGETVVWYRAVHYTSDVGESDPSAAVQRWVGPDAPAAVQVDDGLGTRWYSYRLTWDAVAGLSVEIEDDYQCLGTWATRATMPSGGDSGLFFLPKSSPQQDTGDNGIPA